MNPDKDNKSSTSGIAGTLSHRRTGLPEGDTRGKNPVGSKIREPTGRGDSVPDHSRSECSGSRLKNEVPPDESSIGGSSSSSRSHKNNKVTRSTLGSRRRDVSNSFKFNDKNKDKDIDGDVDEFSSTNHSNRSKHNHTKHDHTKKSVPAKNKRSSLGKNRSRGSNIAGKDNSIRSKNGNSKTKKPDRSTHSSAAVSHSLDSSDSSVDFSVDYAMGSSSDSELEIDDLRVDVQSLHAEIGTLNINYGHLVKSYSILGEKYISTTRKLNQIERILQLIRRQIDESDKSAEKRHLYLSSCLFVTSGMLIMKKDKTASNVNKDTSSGTLSHSNVTDENVDEVIDKNTDINVNMDTNENPNGQGTASGIKDSLGKAEPRYQREPGQVDQPDLEHSTPEDKIKLLLQTLNISETEIREYLSKEVSTKSPSDNNDETPSNSEHGDIENPDPIN